MADTVWLVKRTGYEYNDEGYYSSGTLETVVVCGSEKTAHEWIADNGWSHIGHFLSDREYWGQDPPDYNEPATRAEAVKANFFVVPTAVL